MIRIRAGEKDNRLASNALACGFGPVQGEAGGAAAGPSPPSGLRKSRMRRFVLLLGTLFAVPSLAQDQSTFPATLACDAVPSGPGPTRAQGTLTVTGATARYSLQVRGADGGSGATEMGNGALSEGGRLSLSGSAKGTGRYQARYGGEIGGRGGRLAGEQTGTAQGTPFRRRCQMIVGDR